MFVITASVLGGINISFLVIMVILCLRRGNQQEEKARVNGAGRFNYFSNLLPKFTTAKASSVPSAEDNTSVTTVTTMP